MRDPVLHALVYQDLKMVKMTKYAKILICRARGYGSTIKELCNSFGVKKKTVISILRNKFILPVEKGYSPTDSDKRRILRKMDMLRSNPYLTLEQINLRFPNIYNECCLERVRNLIKEFLESLTTSGNT